MRRGFGILVALCATASWGGCGRSVNPGGGRIGGGPNDLAEDCGIAELDAGTPLLGEGPVGETAVLDLPVHDTADMTETIESVTITGADASAFLVLTAFPLTLPAGTATTLRIQFDPTEVRNYFATLAIQTAAMGTSYVDIAAGGERNPDFVDGGPNNLVADGGTAELDAGSPLPWEASVGQTQTYLLSVQDSSYASETLLGATVNGPDAAAFAVEAAFPINLQDWTTTTLEIQFTPTHTGISSATLAVQTTSMGTLDFSLEAEGMAADGG